MKKTIFAPNITGESHKHNVKTSHPQKSIYCMVPFTWSSRTGKNILGDVSQNSDYFWGEEKLIERKHERAFQNMSNILYFDLGDGYMMSTNVKIYWGTYIEICTLFNGKNFNNTFSSNFLKKLMRFSISFHERN